MKIEWEAIDLYKEYSKDTIAKQYTKEDIDNHKYYFTVGQLKERLKDLPDDMPVVYQRIEDKYFKNSGWRTLLTLWEAWPGRPQDLTETIPAFSAYATYTDTGHKVFMIHAHY